MTLLLRGGEAGMTHGIIDGDEILTVNQYGGRKGSPQIVRGAFCYSGPAHKQNLEHRLVGEPLIRQGV